MSDFDAEVADMDDVIFDEFGEDATVQRGTDPAVPVRIFVERGAAKFGDMGEVVGYATTVSFRNSEWVPKPGDLLTFTGGTRELQSVEKDDGYVTDAVLYGEAAAPR